MRSEPRSYPVVEQAQSRYMKMQHNLATECNIPGHPEKCTLSLTILSRPKLALLEGHSRYDAVNRETGCLAANPEESGVSHKRIFRVNRAGMDESVNVVLSRSNQVNSQVGHLRG